MHVEQNLYQETSEYKEGISVEVESLTQEACGIVAFYNFASDTTPQEQSDQFQTVLTAGSKLQHRGPHGAGRVIQTELGIQRKVGIGKVGEVFTAQDVLEVSGYEGTSWTVLQTRYGTNGHYGKDNLQPCTAKTPEGDIVTVVHNGEFTGTEQMREALWPQVYDSGISDSYLFTQLLAQTPGKNSDEKVLAALSRVNGAASLAIGIGDVLYITKSDLGIRPLVTGKVGDNFIAASETVALDAVGATELREVLPGEVIRIDKKGRTTLKQATGEIGYDCSIEDVYFKNSLSKRPKYESPDDNEHPERWVTMKAIRYRSGKILARETPITNLDLVVGVPGTGVDIANGYADEIGTKYLQVINQTTESIQASDRAFLGDDAMSEIKKKVLRKLIINSDRRIWEGKNVGVGDDSIIRGNVSSVLVDVLFDLGIRELHFFSGFPPVRHPCHLGVSIRNTHELIAVDGADEEIIAKRIVSLANIERKREGKELIPEAFPMFVHFITPTGLMEARNPNKKIVVPENPDHIGLENHACLGCVNHAYPISKEGVIYDYKSQNPQVAA